jgi:lysozyme
MSLIDNIKKSEGFRSKVYKCTEGYDTIGYGFAIKDLHLDEDICNMILERKLAELKIRVVRQFPFFDDCPEEVQDVLMEMCFQIGVKGVSKFSKTIDHIMRKDYRSASSEMLLSKWATQTPNRAKKLSDQMKYAR